MPSNQKDFVPPYVGLAMPITVKSNVLPPLMRRRVEGEWFLTFVGRMVVMTEHTPCGIVF